MTKKNNRFAALLAIAQDQQGYFTTKQAIEAGYADNTHPYSTSGPGIGSGFGPVSIGWLICPRRKTGR